MTIVEIAALRALAFELEEVARTSARQAEQLRSMIGDAPPSSDLAVRAAAIRICEITAPECFPELREALGADNPPGRRRAP